jgi:hypothetical protein
LDQSKLWTLVSYSEKEKSEYELLVWVGAIH